jgi:hypothetical protein
LELAICGASTKEPHIVLSPEELKAMRERFYSKSFSNLRIVLKKKGWLVDKGKSITPGVKYLKTINA